MPIIDLVIIGLPNDIRQFIGKQKHEKYQDRHVVARLKGGLVIEAVSREKLNQEKRYSCRRFYCIDPEIL